MLSEAEILAEAFRRIHALAPTLKHVELRVLIALFGRVIGSRNWQDSGIFTTRQSSRDLAAEAGIARSSAQAAIDELTARHIISLRQGTATNPAAYMLRSLEAKPIVAMEPGEVAQNSGHRGGRAVRIPPIVD